MLGWLKKITGRTESAAPAQLTNAALARRYLALARSGILRSRYDAAASADVRSTLRNRAHYEVANNTYAGGIVLTLANNTIGNGPRLQLLTAHDAVNRQVEVEFELWSQEVCLAQKLSAMRMARARDGEMFASRAEGRQTGFHLSPGAPGASR